MTSGGRNLAGRRTLARVLILTIAGTALALVGLAALNGSVSTGWRLFVLDRVFKAAWAVSIAILAGAASLMITASAGSRRIRGPARQVFREVVGLMLACAIAVGALDYFLPDWTRVTIMSGVVVLLLWIFAVFAAL
jgi:hypothetical protein